MLGLRTLKRLFIVSALATAGDSIAASCQLTQVADWPVKLIANHLVVDGAINGRRVGVMLDTGGISMIYRSASDRLGLTRHQAQRYRLFGVGGESYVEAALVDEFKVGDLVRKSWEVMVAGERGAGPSIDVVLGEDVFEQVDVEFDLHHGRVRLFQPKGCEAVALGYWAPQGTSRLDFAPGPRVLVPVTINGNAVEAEFDSGAGTSILDKATAARVGIGPETPGASLVGRGGGVGAHSVEYWIAPVKSFTIGDETIDDTMIAFADLFRDATYTGYFASRLPQKAEHMPSMLLGADFLRAHRVLISHSQRRMYFSYEGGPVFQLKPPAGITGASAAPGEKASMPPPVPEVPEPASK